MPNDELQHPSTLHETVETKIKNYTLLIVKETMVNKLVKPLEILHSLSIESLAFNF